MPYVDLSLLTDSHVGTEQDPFSFTDQQTHVATAASGQTYYMKGIASGFAGGTNFAGANGNHSYLPWDALTNGPWRLQSTTNLPGMGTCTFTGGIIKTELGAIGGATFFNMWLHCNPGVGTAWSIAGMVAYGSMVISDGSIDPFPGTVLTDCGIKKSIFGGGTGAVFNNCAMSGAIFSPADFSTCQINWTVPAIPAWNAAKEAFNYKTFYAGVTTPPQPGAGYPAYTGYEYDLWGEGRIGLGTGYTKRPIWAATYPKAGTVGKTTAEILTETDSNGTAYFVTLLTGSAAPTSDQVKAGQDASGTLVAAGFSGSVSLTANTEATLNTSNLANNTDYTTYVVAEDSTSLLQAIPYTITFTTLGPPMWESNTPSLATPNFFSITYNVEISKNGIVYFVTLLSGATAPSSVEVKAGTGYNGVTPIDSGSISLSGNTPGTLTAENLKDGIIYDTYFTAEDLTSDLQLTPTLVTASTIATTPSEISPETFKGMPPKNNFTPKGTLLDTNLANPLGNKVVNTAGINTVDGTIEGKPVRTHRGSGSILGMYSKPSWLCN